MNTFLLKALRKSVKRKEKKLKQTIFFYKHLKHQLINNFKKPFYLHKLSSSLIRKTKGESKKKKMMIMMIIIKKRIIDKLK